MPVGAELLVFLAAGFLLNLTPGADMLYIISRGAGQGQRAGVVAALGIGAGCLVHIALSVIGLWAIIQTSPEAFSLLKYVGAAYLAYLGLSLILAKRSHFSPPVPARGNASMWRVFWQGVLVNVLNPKIAVFFLAFLPQFIDADSHHKTLVFVLLGLIFNTVGTAWNVFVGWSAARVGQRLLTSPTTGRWLRTTMGGFFILLAARLAVSEHT